jgi:HEAT repeat protein
MTTDPAEPLVARVRSVQPDASGRVQISLEEVRNRVVSGRMDDGNIQRLLMAAAREETDPGVRVESVDILKDHAASAEVRAALLNSAAHDGNPGVRMKALEGLKRFAAADDVRKTLAQILLKDDNPGVRIQAIDMLTSHRDAAMVGVLQNMVGKEDNSYVRWRCEKALKEMNASVGTF